MKVGRMDHPSDPYDRFFMLMENSGSIITVMY